MEQNMTTDQGRCEMQASLFSSQIYDDFQNDDLLRSRDSGKQLDQQAADAARGDGKTRSIHYWSQARPTLS